MFWVNLLLGFISIAIWPPSYATGWLLLRLVGCEAESVKDWWSRIRSVPRRSAVLKYEKDGRQLITAENASHIGCLFWLTLLVLLPLGFWFLVSLFVS